MSKIRIELKTRDLSLKEALESKNLYENVQKFFELQNRLKEEQRNKTLGIKKSSKFGLFKKSTLKKEKTSPRLRNVTLVKSSFQTPTSIDQVITRNMELIPEVPKKRISLNILDQLIENLEETIEEYKDSITIAKHSNSNSTAATSTTSTTISNCTNSPILNNFNNNAVRAPLLRVEGCKWVNFSKFVQIPGGLESFDRFLCMEFSHENILFWCEVERYKNTEDIKMRTKFAENIFETFIGATAYSELNLSFTILKEVQRRIMLGTFDKTLFREAQREIKMLMEADSFRRYLLSTEYKNFKELNTIIVETD